MAPLHAKTMPGSRPGHADRRAARQGTRMVEPVVLVVTGFTDSSLSAPTWLPAPSTTKEPIPSSTSSWPVKFELLTGVPPEVRPMTMEVSESSLPSPAVIKMSPLTPPATRPA